MRTALDRVFDAHGAEIAAAIVEPLPANYGLLPQRDAWLQHLADRCRRAGALLIFDEVISGFRVGKTGMAGLLGIRPDLVTYGKVIGGGFPGWARMLEAGPHGPGRPGGQRLSGRNAECESHRHARRSCITDEG